VKGAHAAPRYAASRDVMASPLIFSRTFGTRSGSIVPTLWQMSRTPAIYRGAPAIYNGKLFRVTADNHLVALEMKTGRCSGIRNTPKRRKVTTRAAHRSWPMAC
jgi:hypothetical protein